MSDKWDSQANEICRAASAKGQIARESVNVLRRTFALLGDAAQAAVRAIDGSIVNGATKIIEDGSGIFDKHGNRRG